MSPGMGLVWLKKETWLLRLLRWGSWLCFLGPCLKSFPLFQLSIGVTQSPGCHKELQELLCPGLVSSLSTRALPCQPQRSASLGPSWAGRWVSPFVAERVRISQGGLFLSFPDIGTTVFSGGLGVTDRR